jgi:PAS domain S-box-containing protein
MTLRARVLTAGCALLAALALTAHGVAFALSDGGQVWAVNVGWTLAGVVLVVTHAAAALRAPRGGVRTGWIYWTAVSAVWLAGIIVGDVLAWGGDLSVPTAPDYLAWLFALLVIGGLGRRFTFSASLAVFLLDALPVVLLTVGIGVLAGGDRFAGGGEVVAAAVLYPALYTLMALVGLQMHASKVEWRRSPASWPFLIGLWLLALAGITWSAQAVRADATQGHLSDVLWTLGVLALAYGGLRRALSAGEFASPPVHVRDTAPRALLPAVGVVALAGLVFVVPVETQALVEALAFVAVGSLAVRSFIIRRVSGRLVADLERSRLALTEDVAKRKLVEGEMRQSETKFRTLVTNLPAAVYRCAADDEYTMEFLSDQVEEICGYPASDFVGHTVRSFEIAEISGYPASNLVGKSVRSFASIIHRDDLGVVGATLMENVARGEVFDLKYRIRHADGSIRWVQDRGQGISGKDGRLLYLDGAILDITAQKESEGDRERLLRSERSARLETEDARLLLADQNERLRELDGLKDEFVSLVSHELRTPLTSIRGYLELVLDGAAGSLTEEQDRFLRVVERNADRLLGLVGDLLFVAQVDAGRLPVEFDDLDLALVAAECVDGVRPAAEAKSLELILDASPLAAKGDRGRLDQLLGNLVSNAVKFTPEGGRVTVSVSSQDESALIEVSDNGIGVPEAELDELFTRFFRSSTATENAIPGTGLGLVIAKAIAEAHGGQIAVESRQGVGTTFKVTLPLEPALAEAA